MRRHLDGHIVDFPDFRLGLHRGGAGHLVRQVYREVISLSEETRPRDGRVAPTYTKLESSAPLTTKQQQQQTTTSTTTTATKEVSIYININI